MASSTITNVNNNHSLEKENKSKGKRGKVLSPRIKVKSVVHKVAAKSPKSPRRGKQAKKARNAVAMDTNINNSFGEDNDLEMEVTRFEEDGEIINMEITDGGAAAAEFQSEEEDESESEESEGTPTDHSETEAGEITEDSEVEQESAGEPESPIPQKRCKQDKARRESVEARLDSLTDSLNVVKEFVMTQIQSQQANKKTGVKSPKADHAEGKNERKRTKQKGQLDNGPNPSISDVTIYKNAVEMANPSEGLGNVGDDSIEVDSEITFKRKNDDTVRGRDSSSSDDRIDTSDEMMEIDINKQFIVDCQNEARRRSVDKTPYAEPPEQSRGAPQSEKIIRDIEMTKAVQYGAKGKVTEFLHPWEGPKETQRGGSHQLSSEVDDNYVIIGAHLDNSIREKIQRGEYVDFNKLLPKVSSSDDQRMELVNKGGQSFFVPVSDRESSSITNFSKWEQAFRIFMNVFTQEHPDRATELIQYNHVIFTAASSYSWENVSIYDKEFRIHMSRYPNRSWAAILQQAWTLYLKDRVKHDNQKFNNNGNGNGNKRKRDACKRFNKGLCTAGMGCRFDHRCLECGKFGHGAHICRRRLSASSGKANPGGGAGASTSGAR